jgi:hypothetical protein
MIFSTGRDIVEKHFSLRVVIGISLALGVITTVSVSWILPFQNRWIAWVPTSTSPWEMSTPKNWPTYPNNSAKTSNWALFSGTRVQYNDRTPGMYWYQRLDTGFPLPCMRSRVLAELTGAYTIVKTTSLWDEGYTFSEISPVTSGKRIPLIILPLPFILNTIFWIFVWTALFLVGRFSIGMMKGVYRRNPDIECIKCGYPRSAADVCPECGHGYD